MPTLNSETPSILDVAEQIADLGMLNESAIEAFIAMTSLTAEDLSELRQMLQAAVANVDRTNPTDNDIERLTASAWGVRLLDAQSNGALYQSHVKRQKAERLTAILTADPPCVDCEPDAKPASGAPVLPTISHLAARAPGRSRPRPSSRLSPGAKLLTAAGEPAQPSETAVEVFAAALEREVRAAMYHDGPPRRELLMSLQADYPPERTLSDSDELNARRIEAAISPKALAASGGICAPVAVKYDVLSVNSALRPVRDDALAHFGAARGGARYILPHTLAQVTADGPASVWTQANDITLNAPATKPHATFSCQSVKEDFVDAVTAVVNIGNFQYRYFPEQVQQYMDAVAAVHSRLAEATLLAAMTTGSTACTADIGELGAVREFLPTIDRAAAAIRYRHRMAPDAPLHLVYPEWLEDMVRTDLARSLPGDSGGRSERLAVADAEIDHFFAVRNINTSDALDSPAGAPTLQGWGVQGVGTLNPWPAKTVCWLYPEGSWLLLDGGTLDLGLIRDSTLSRTNDAQFWMESFEKAVFVGVESLAITCGIFPTGASSGTVSASSYYLGGS
jgi:hypothetical protein